MMKRHSDDLENRLDELTFEPMIKISKRYLRRIYGVDRVGKNTWRDVFERLPANLTADDVCLIEDNDEVYIMRKSILKEAVTFI
jgi:hypothetical protein